MARHKNGWVKIYRAAILGDIGSNYIRGGLFQALVAIANLQPSVVSWAGKPRRIHRGEMVTSLLELAELGEVDVKTVSRHLNYLVLRETITVEKCSSGTFIRINNFEEYQGQDAEGSKPSPSDEDNHRDNDVQTTGIHNEELNNKRNKELKNKRLRSLFEEVYKKYPRKEGKKEGLDYLVKKYTEADIPNLEKAILKYRAKIAADKTPPKFIKLFSSFVGSWTDWLDEDAGTTDLNAKNYKNETETDHDAELKEAWSA